MLRYFKIWNSLYLSFWYPFPTKCPFFIITSIKMTTLMGFSQNIWFKKIFNNCKRFLTKKCWVRTDLLKKETEVRCNYNENFTKMNDAMSGTVNNVLKKSIILVSDVTCLSLSIALGWEDRAWNTINTEHSKLFAVDLQMENFNMWF